MSPLFNSKPPVTSGISSMEVQRIVHFLTDHFKVEQPKIKFSNMTRRGKYSVLHQTIIMGPRCWRGVHTAVHEFAHHLDMVRRGQAGKWMPRPTSVRRTYIGGGAFANLTHASRREFHGESFTMALEDCVMAVFGDQNLYSWETEYKSVKASHAKRFVHREKSEWKVSFLGIDSGLSWALPMAAEKSQPKSKNETIEALCAERCRLQQQYDRLTKLIKAANTSAMTAMQLTAERKAINAPYNAVVAKIKALRGEVKWD
jgi:hypothetical protein